VEFLQRVHLFADADKLDRLAGDSAHRERSATAAVAVHAGQDEAGDADAFVGDDGDGASRPQLLQPRSERGEHPAPDNDVVAAAGKFDLNDLSEQLRQMQKMGGMGGIMGMMPGMGKMKDQLAAAGLDDKMFKRQVAIISSMTKAERANPDILKHSRKKRIAAGSGTDAAEINKLLKMHRGMGDMMKAMGGKGKGAGMMRGMMGGLASKMGLGGMMQGGGMGGMPDLSKMDPKQLEALKKQAQAAGLGGAGMKGLPGLGGGGLPKGLPGLGGPKLPGLGSPGGPGGLPGFGRKK
jgi:signal recognition particle subunit SRP54